MIQGVIFDFDNTLYNYDMCNCKALEKVFEYLKTYLSDKDLILKEYNKINKSIKNSNTYSNKFNKSIYFKKLFENLNIDLVHLDLTLKVYEQEFILNLKLFDGINELLEDLVKHKIKIILASNNVFTQQYNKLKELEIINFFDLIVTSDEVGNEKPNEQFYINLIHKSGLHPENIIMIGDNYEHDIEPAILNKMIPFHYVFDDSDVKIKNKYFEFGSYDKLKYFLSNYFESEQEYIYISKYFGQSILNIQGQGGNISIKFNELMLIKSSGCILANTDLNTGFCIVNNEECIKRLRENDSNLKTTKLFGHKIPSMETYFHSFMKKYTVHLHFILSNIFLCGEEINILSGLNIPHKIINYYPPGLILAQKIFDSYTEDCNLYFLNNHGIIITGNTIEEIIKLYENIFLYFDSKLELKYSREYISFKITKKIFKIFTKTIVCRCYNNLNIEYINNLKYCFPDLAVYIQKIYPINNLNQIYNFNDVPEIIIYNSQIYLLSDNLTKLYCLIETLDLYSELSKNNFEKLKIIDEKSIQAMEQEKYRKNN